jgi:hypothetical protein
MQLNIFDNNRDIMLRNDVVIALERRNATPANAALDRFTEEFPLDDKLSPLYDLVDVVSQKTDVLFNDHQALRDTLHIFSRDIEPAAHRIFGPKVSSQWLTHLKSTGVFHADRVAEASQTIGNNQPIADAQTYMQNAASDIEGTCYKAECAYWKK